MDILDFIAFFIYIIIFSLIFSVFRKKIKNVELRAYHKYAFWIKVFACFSYSIFVLYIVKGGDTMDLYYPEGLNMFRRILNGANSYDLLLGPVDNIDPNTLANPNQMGYLRDPSNLFTIRFTAILCFLSFGKFLVVNLFYAMIAFTGIWKLYRFFAEQFPDMRKPFAFAILLLPTFTFWSSGILKDPLAVSALGWFTFALFQLAVEKKNLIRNLLIIIITFYVFSVIKIYIIIAYLPAFSIFLLLKNAQLLKNPVFKFMLIVGFIIISVISFSAIATRMQNAIADYAGEDIVEGISEYQQTYKKKQQSSEGAYFSLGVEFDGTVGSLLKVAPMAVIATLYRPFLWESRNISTLLSSLESLFMMLFTLYVIFKVGLIRFIRTIIKKPIVLYCYFFSISFALFVGATTLNFGTLVRYKIPCMPFYVISLFMILYFNKNKKIKNTENTAVPVPV